MRGPHFTEARFASARLRDFSNDTEATGARLDPDDGAVRNILELHAILLFFHYDVRTAKKCACMLILESQSMLSEVAHGKRLG